MDTKIYIFKEIINIIKSYELLKHGSTYYSD